MKKVVSVFLALLILMTTLFSTAMLADAATIKDKHTATGVKSGQTIYITTNTGWNTELFGNTYRTKVRIALDKNQGMDFSQALSTNFGVNVTVYKKSGSKWVKQSNLSGTFKTCPYAHGSYLTKNSSIKTWVLPGKGVQYKIVITPNSNYTTLYPNTQLTNMTVKITSYGRITKVS